MYDVLEAPLAPEDALVEAGSAARNGITADDARAIAAYLGLPTELGQEFRCILPHAAGLSVVDPASLRYQTLYNYAFKEWWSLAEVYASRVAGHLMLLRRGATAARWWLRLRYLAGLTDITAPELDLPTGLSMPAVRLAYGFALVSALSDAKCPGDPAAYSRRFAMDWCGGLPQRTVADGIRELTITGVLLHAGSIERGHRAMKPTPLYRLSPAVTHTPTAPEALIA
jgi:hypothetical protein